MSGDPGERTWQKWAAAPVEQPPTQRAAARLAAAPAARPALRRRPATGANAISPRLRPVRRGRLRGTLLPRLLQFPVIPLAALLVAGWGIAGMPDPSGSIDESGTPAATGSSNRPLPAITAPAGPATPEAGPARRSAATGDGVPRPTAPPRPTRPVSLAGTPSPPVAGTPAAPVAVDCVPPAVLPAPTGTALVTTEIANLRAHPGLTCAVLREIPAETALTALSGIVRGDEVDWLLVEAEGATAWVSARLVAPAQWAATTVPSATRAATAPTATATASATATPGVPIASGCRPPASLPPVREPGQIVTAAAVNLRQGPGLGCAIITVLPAGTEATPGSSPVRADGRLWVMVEVEGTTGWVAADFLAEAD